MTQNNNISEALEMIKSHDWYWMMSEEYTRSYNTAKASMRAFVATVNTITDASIREALKALWVLKSENARKAINGKEEDKQGEANLMNKIALAC